MSTQNKNYTISGTPAQGLTGATLGFFIGFAAVTLFAPLVSTLKLTPAQTGLLLSISSLTGSLLRIPFAAMVDTTGGKKPMLILLGIAIVGMLGIYFLLGKSPEQVKEQFGMLVLFGALAGCGIATFSVGIGHTSYWYPQKEQGKALGTYAGVGNLAPGIFVFLITNYLMQSLGLRNTYLLWTVLLLAGTIVYALIGKNAWYFQLRKQGASAEDARAIAEKEYRQEMFPRGNAMQSLAASAKIWQTWVMVFVYFFSFGGFLALTNWFKEFFNNYHQMTIATAGLLTSIYSIGASICRVFGGGLADKLGGRNISNIFLIVSGLGSLLLATSGNLVLNIIGLLCMTAGMGIVNAGVFKMLPQFVPGAIGGAAGWVGGLGALGGFVLPNILSGMLKSGKAGDSGYLAGFYVFTVLVVLSLVLINLLPKTTSK